MKVLIILALAVAITSAFDLRRHKDDQQRNNSRVIPAVEVKNERIFNGQIATVGQFPYQVGISLKITYLGDNWCGGSLIGENWILTAAHCTCEAQSAVVYLGSVTFMLAEVVLNVSSSDIIIHPGFDSSTLINDISLIKIPTVSYSLRIRPVRLPSFSNSYSSYVGNTGIASGWGQISDFSSVSKELQWASMKIVSNDVCNNSFGNRVTSSNICISSDDGASTCRGDSGGPLVLENENILAGISSFGARSCAKGHPAVFTSVTNYLDWIGHHTNIFY